MRFVSHPVSTCLWLLLCIPHLAGASVVLSGTRVIYPEALSAKTLQLSNEGTRPALVQVWMDAGHPNSEPGDAEEVPFVANPPIFRIDPHGGQAVRLMYTGDDSLPTDRESLFYLNFSELPALEEDELEGNALLMQMSHRVKLFYRPRGLKPAQPDTQALACGLRFEIAEGRVQVDNPGAFHAVVARAELVQDGREVVLLEAQTLAPFARFEQPLDEAVTPHAGAQVRIRLINDLGADVRHDCPWR